MSDMSPASWNVFPRSRLMCIWQWWVLNEPNPSGV